ncbi:HAD-IA family hydrolase, partial [Streptomyces sp. NRRL B-3648]|uniref:HAD-IA family hydrolase n=1 Tax=Streptomyces sp. NRRL B-3648 TaxID=1519493 RepID=UPI003B63968D
PHPEGFLKGAAELGVDPADCVVFEDSGAGIAAGGSAGMTVGGVGPRAGFHEPDVAGKGPPEGAVESPPGGKGPPHLGGAAPPRSPPRSPRTPHSPPGRCPVPRRP